jgi:hypothetical protein
MSDELDPELKAYFDSKGSAPLETAKKADEPAKDEKTEAPETTAKADEPAPERAEKPDDDGPEADDVADNGDDNGQQTDKQRKVSYSAYRREQQQRKEAEARAAKLAEEQQRYIEEMRKRDEVLNQRLAMMMQAQQTQQAPQQPQVPAEPEIPDPEQDIFGATKFMLDKFKQMEAERAEAARQQQMQRAEQQRRAEEMQRRATHEKAVIDKYNELGEIRAKQDPEFVPAYDYARQKRIEQLMRDEGMTEAAAKKQTTIEEFTLAERALRSGQDPTERIKRYALDLGFRYDAKPKEAAAPQRLDSIAKAQDAQKTLTGSGSPGSARSVITAKDLASMSSDEFTAFLEKGGDKAFKAAMTR